jgi:hypothetical protein
MNPNLMSPRYCGLCGHDKPPINSHHLAAKKNHPHWIIPACKDCHLIVTAWQYADRILVTGADTREPLDQQQQHKMLMLALTRISELISHANHMPEYMLLFAALADLKKRYGDLPAPKYRNPAPIPNSIPTHAQERVIAAQIAIFAFIMEEWLGFDHPLPVTLRKVEREPFAWTFDDSPGLGMIDLSSDKTTQASILAMLTAGFQAFADEYVRRWKHL